MGKQIPLDTPPSLLLYVSTNYPGIRWDTDDQFYYGYIVSVLPWALVFARYPLAKTTAICVFFWGLVCILTVLCHNYPGALVQRIFLGLTESAVPPAFVAVTNLWYKPYEQATRMGMWYSAYGLANMSSGLINFGLGHVKMAHPWKAM